VELISRDPSVLATPVDGGLMLMHVGSSRFFSGDEIAADVWHELETPCAVADVVVRLCARYHADPAVISADVRTLLDKLEACGLVKRG
jgi:hypothetical protein